MSDLHRPMTKQAARKAHRCIACYTTIPIGEVYSMQTGFYDGAAYRNKYHNECWDALIEDGCNFEFTPGCCEPPERLRA